jgi:hypothetical protein
MSAAEAIASNSISGNTFQILMKNTTVQEFEHLARLIQVLTLVDFRLLLQIILKQQNW